MWPSYLQNLTAALTAQKSSKGLPWKLALCCVMRSVTRENGAALWPVQHATNRCPVVLKRRGILTLSCLCIEKVGLQFTLPREQIQTQRFTYNFRLFKRSNYVSLSDTLEVVFREIIWNSLSEVNDFSCQCSCSRLRAYFPVWVLLALFNVVFTCECHPCSSFPWLTATCVTVIIAVLNAFFFTDNSAIGSL